MVTKVQGMFPKVTAAQIHQAWTEMSEPLWRFDNDQLRLTKLLLHEHTNDVDIFELQGIPEGVDIICFGLKRIAMPLKGKIVEIGVEATYNMNSKHLELYSIMGEHDGAGFPLLYLLLSTASSIDQGKRTTALTSWAKCVRDAYGITAKFTHVDKDMAEIKMLKDVWNAKISLCWWHLRRAKQLPMILIVPMPNSPSLTLGQADAGEYEGGAPEIVVTPVVPPSQQPMTMTMPNGLRFTIPAPGHGVLGTVNVNGQARTEERSGIDSVDKECSAGLTPLPEAMEVDGTVPGRAESSLSRRGGQQNEPAPAREPGTVLPPTRTLKQVMKEKENKNSEVHEDVRTTKRGRIVKSTRNLDAADPAVLARAMNARTTVTAPTAKKARAKVAGDVDITASKLREAGEAAEGGAAKLRAVGDEADTTAATSSSKDDENEGEKRKHTRHTFCPANYREHIVSMMEKHYCAHPLLPGYAHPSAEGIRRWAVLQMYKFCVEAGLREVWAYLWENWYRSSRWELWARSVNPEIPFLKTTMILESHWRRIKHDFLHHFHMPRCDLLVWILIVKLAPTFYRKLDRLLTDTGRYRELPAWHKDCKRVGRRLEKTPITLPVNPAYKTDGTKMTCPCPSLAVSRFLLCKHVVQSFKPVPPVFFLEVKRQRTAPFWTHPSLELLSETLPPEQASRDVNSGTTLVDSAGDVPLGSEEDDDDDLVDTQPNDDRRTFVEAMDENIDLIIEVAKGLKYQRQFRDQRMLQTLEREGASFLRLGRRRG
ncbi:SWIM-type domain-containing protein [Mycena sanguinolenta]|uniref:SWIM-type domain-containing protein n=1 Tax=Mycena sanguinolenta TaxID=230812 RepID=A0A8H6YUZ2_9AGAR|nr:SWIM-type domain-containing protein [Mycena sanguinolenta]